MEPARGRAFGAGAADPRVTDLRSVPSQSDMDAQRYRPRSAAELRPVAIRLARQGLTPRDIAPHLGLSELAVRQLLEEAA